MDNLNLVAALPEILIALAAMGFLMLGVFWKDARAVCAVYWGVVGLLILFGLWAATGGMPEGSAFGGAFSADGFGHFAKALIFLSAAAVMIIGRDYLFRAGMMQFELPVLMLLAVLGMALMVSAGDLIALYMGLELQSLALYVLASFRRDSSRSTEAGLNYFVLGATIERIHKKPNEMLG